MDTSTTHSQLSRVSLCNLSIPLHHRQSKLHLLDSTTMTSFPSPEMKIDTPFGNTGLSDARSTSIDLSSSVNHSDSNFQTGQQQEMELPANTHQILNSFISKTKHGLTYSKSAPYLSATNNIDINSQLNGAYKYKSSVPDSIMSNNIISTSKITTPPSSYDHTSPYYDYRLVLENSEQDLMDQKNIDNSNKQKQEQEQEHSKASIKINDKYIKSIYDDIYFKNKVNSEIKCITCDLPVFDNGKYINKFLEFNEIICESCINKTTISSNNFQKNSRVGNDSSTLDMYTSPNDTANTVQVHFDTTIQSDEDLTLEQQRIINSFSSKNNNDNRNDNNHGYDYDNDTNINNIYEHNKYANIIKNLKQIENRDLKVRQSIADFRGFNDIDNNNETFNHKHTLIWNFFKRKFINFE